MALTEEQVIDKMEIVQTGAFPVLQIREASVISRDGEEISRMFHRRVLTPDADLSGESAEVAKIAKVIFTAAAKAAYAAAMAESAP